MAKLKFTPTPQAMTYVGQALSCPAEGVYDCLDDLALKLTEKFPASFSLIAEMPPDQEQPEIKEKKGKAK